MFLRFVSYFHLIILFILSQTNLIRTAAVNYLLEAGVEWGAAPAVKVRNPFSASHFLYLKEFACYFVLNGTIKPCRECEMQLWIYSIL